MGDVLDVEIPDFRLKNILFFNIPGRLPGIIFEVPFLEGEVPNKGIEHIPSPTP